MRIILVKNLKVALLFFLTLICLYSCQNTPIEIEKLKSLDKMIWDVQRMEHWNQYHLNHSKTCKLVGQSWIPDQILIDSLLIKNQIDEVRYNEALKTFKQLGIKEYFRVDPYSVYVEGGGFGNIYGYVLSHSTLKEIPKRLDLKSRYQINIGKSIDENIYFFWSD